jgi:hypothetical protein
MSSVLKVGLSPIGAWRLPSERTQLPRSERPLRLLQKIPKSKPIGIFCYQDPKTMLQRLFRFPESLNFKCEIEMPGQLEVGRTELLKFTIKTTAKDLLKQGDLFLLCMAPAFKDVSDSNPRNQVKLNRHGEAVLQMTPMMKGGHMVDLQLYKGTDYIGDWTIPTTVLGQSIWPISNVFVAREADTK